MLTSLKNAIVTILNHWALNPTGLYMKTPWIQFLMFSMSFYLLDTDRSVSFSINENQI